MDPTSPYYADQNELYRGKGWNSPPFCASQMAKLRTTAVAGQRGGLLRSVRVVPGKRSVRVRVFLSQAATVAVVVRRGKRTVARTSRRRAAGVRAITLRVPRGKLSVVVSARRGGKREVVRLTSRRAG